MPDYSFTKKKRKKRNWVTWNNNLSLKWKCLDYAVMGLKDVDEKINRIDSDQTAPNGSVWSGSALFAQTYLSQYLNFFGISYIAILVQNIILNYPSWHIHYLFGYMRGFSPLQNQYLSCILGLK